MSDELKNYFITLEKLLGAISSEYESFLYDQSIKNEKLAKRFLPQDLQEKLPLIKKAREDALA